MVDPRVDGREAKPMSDVQGEHRPGGGASLDGARILIVEDQPEVADLLVIAVTGIGGEVIAVAATMDGAMALIRSEAISIAIVTKVVRGVHADVVARELVRRGIPYVVTAGTGAARGHPELHAALTITKPFLMRYVQVVLLDIAAQIIGTKSAPPRARLP